MFTIGLYLFCIAIEGDFYQKIQAKCNIYILIIERGHILTISELCGSLYYIPPFIVPFTLSPIIYTQQPIPQNIIEMIFCAVFGS